MISKLHALAGSIVVKVAAMLLIVGGTTVAAIWTSFTLFGEFSGSLGRFQDEAVPRLQKSSQIIERAGDVGEGLSGLLIAGSSEEMTRSLAEADAAIAALHGSASELDGQMAQSILADIRDAASHLKAVAEARRDDIVFDDATLRGSEALSAAVADASRLLAGIAGDAFERVLSSDASETILDKRTELQDVERAVQLERRLGEIQSVVLTGASADDAEGVAAAQAATAELVSEIVTLSSAFSGNAELAAAIERIMSNTDAADGILAARQTVIGARQKADAAARLAAEEVHAITVSARDLGHNSIVEIETASGRLQTAADGGRSAMTTIAAISVIALALATAATLLFIVRPLVAVTRVTERLSKGDLRPVTGLERQRGEIGRMAGALTVFRDGMIDQQRLQEEERQREHEARERAEKEDREAREREEAERARQRRVEAEERERETKELQAREAMRAETEAERKARAEEQERVVSSLARGMKKLAEGDLGVRLDQAFPTAYEALRNDFNAALTSLSDLIGQIVESAGKIDDSATEISSASHELSRRTESSAASLEETAAALNQLTSSVASAAEGAGHANRIADATNSKAETSRDVVGEAISAMAEIEGSSKKIATIIGVIDDIAFQTNLLALNAGVEAARAGEAGRGFAVVASEVRALAQRSSEAAREINSLISTSNGQVERGAKLVDDAGAALQEIIVGVAEITRNVGEIATSAREQACGIDEINTATGQLDSTMQRNAAMTEETTAASQVLMNESRKLREMVERFSVDAEDPHEPLRQRVA